MNVQAGRDGSLHQGIPNVACSRLGTGRSGTKITVLALEIIHLRIPVDFCCVVFVFCVVADQKKGSVTCEEEESKFNTSKLKIHLNV